MAPKKKSSFVTDDDAIEGQSYVLLSFVAPDARQKHADGTTCSLKIRGAFGTMEEAREQVELLQQADNNMYDIYVAEMGKWLPFPPDPQKIPNQEYAEDFLNTMHKSYMENQQERKKIFGARKEKIMKEGLDKHLLPDEVITRPDGSDVAGPSSSNVAGPSSSDVAGPSTATATDDELPSTGPASGASTPTA